MRCKVMPNDRRDVLKSSDNPKREEEVQAEVQGMFLSKLSCWISESSGVIVESDGIFSMW